MSIVHRPMRPKDIRQCVEMVSSAPVARARYGDAIEDLAPAWMQLLTYEAKSAMVFEEVAESRSTLCAVGVSVFVGDDFVRELKRAPFWFRPELARRLRRGDSPLLGSRQLREANSRGGLTALVWEGFISPRFEMCSEVYRKLANAFIEEHSGYLWKELISHQIDSADRLTWGMQTGALFWNAAAGEYTDCLGGQAPEDIIKSPHVFGLSREAEARRPGSWVGSLFDYQPPCFGFTRSEQRLLLSALNGGTDQELSDDLGLSVFTVKKMWRAIYDRVAAAAPDLVPHNFTPQNGDAALDRGREKKQRLISYLRNHPEELRPVSRRLFREAAPQPRQESPH